MLISEERPNRSKIEIGVRNRFRRRNLGSLKVWRLHRALQPLGHGHNLAIQRRVLLLSDHQALDTLS